MDWDEPRCIDIELYKVEEFLEKENNITVNINKIVI